MSEQSTTDEPLGLTVHSAPLPDERAAMTRRGRWQALAVILICAMPVLASYYSFYVIGLSGKAYGELIVPTVDIPETLSLRDLAGQPVAPASLKGQWLLTVVQPASCDKACEDQLYMQRQLREMLGKERDKVDKLWLIPDDEPLRAELREVLAKGEPVHTLRAPRAQIEAWLKPAQGGQLQDHLYVVDPVGRWMLREPANPDPSKVKKDLDRLMKANAGWDKAGR